GNVQHRGGMKLQMFGEDAEGLPVPMDMPRQDTLNPTPEVLKKYLAMGKQVYQDEAQSLTFKSGATAELQRENGFTRLLQLTSPGTSLGCAVDEGTRESDCQCLSKP